ncbi:MAG: acetoacetate decarboxylase family protein [Candidatus Omnitrophica bacterium]|nr:acetoacetate decarboxylase family protein [Candidatus Omnitrophota bacterium]
MYKDKLLFKSVEVKKVVIDDKEIELPIRYYKDVAMVGIFIASTKQIIDILPTERFRPVEILPSKALVSLIGLCHYDTSIGPFSELDIGIPIFFDTKFALPFFSALFYNKNVNFGIYMYRLFVSDEKALTAGVKVWNYPKVIADIEVEDTPTYRIMKVNKDGKCVIKFMVRKQSRRKEELQTTFNIYSIKDNKILKSPVDWKGKKCFARFSHFSYFELGESEYAKDLKLLGLRNYCIEAAFYADLQYILNPPVTTYSLNTEKDHV